MTVKELIEILSKMDQNKIVVYPDTYERNEGWRNGYDTAVCEVDGADVNANGDVEIW